MFLKSWVLYKWILRQDYTGTFMKLLHPECSVRSANRNFFYPRFFFISFKISFKAETLGLSAITIHTLFNVTHASIINFDFSS